MTSKVENIVKIVIPIYKTDLDDLEKVSLNQCVLILKNYPIVIIKPDSLDITPILEGNSFEVESFDDSFFAGIEGYNCLMLSSQFYKRFLNTQYILIYQLDAYVFRDDLIKWCDLGYDYIGAPWLCKKKYKNFWLKMFLDIRAKYYKILHIKHRQQCFYKVGNGGFSLRKVVSCYKKTIEMKSTIDFYLSCLDRGSQYNEDVFWALEAVKGEDFLIPSWKEALYFSFDLFPELAYEYTNKSLPFGCHRWNKQLKFWKPIIGK